MFLRKYWLPISVFIVVIVGVSLYYLQTRPPKEPIVVIKTVEPSPKSEVKAPVVDTSQGGHVHADGMFHAGPHEPVEPPQSAAGQTDAPSEEDWSDVTPEQRAQIAKMRADQLAVYVAKWGEPPSPDASYQHFRDNHGNVHRHYRGTVAISDYEYTTMFAPTPEELERYKRLRADLKAATLADEKNGGSWENPSPEVQRLDNEITSLVDGAQREIPYPMGFRYHGEPNSGFLSPAGEKRLDAIAIRDFYQRFGMEHLYELHNESTQFYQKY